METTEQIHNSDTANTQFIGVPPLRLSIDRKVGTVLLSIGSLGTALSILYESTVLAFICLTLIFWGCLFLFVLPAKYVKAEVMDHMSVSSLSAIDQMIENQNLEGKPIYIPVPKGAFLPYDIGFKNDFVYIPRRNVEADEAVEQAFTRNPEGLRITPPGFALANLMEKNAKVNFHELTMDSLIEVLPSVVTHEVEIADSFKIDHKDGVVNIGIGRAACTDLCEEASKLRNICPYIGCPLSSAIACILTRVTNRPVVIQKCTIAKNKISNSFSIL